MEKKLSRLTTEQRFELVAYLDGELDEGATARIEKLLAENAVARKEVELLAATYSLMENLPRPKARPEFTEKTLAMARIEEVRPDVTQSPLYQWSQQAIPYVGWMVAMCAAGLLGFAAMRFWVPQANDPLVQDLDVISEIDRYAEIGSIDFLERLRSSQELMHEIRGEPRANPTR